MKRLLFLTVGVWLLAACDHPLEITGQGDVISQTGQRDCLYEDFLAGAENCTRNTVIGAYVESYSGAPRTGWIFAGWSGCGPKPYPNCTYNVPEATVSEYWGQTMPPLRAIFVRPLNDTGQIVAADPVDPVNFGSCAGLVPGDLAGLQDCATGRDATHNDNSDGHAGFSFTKLDAQGDPLPADSTSWSCVRDNVTGLVWEHKTNDGSVHDRDNRYRWGGIGADQYDTEFYSDWNSLVTATNNEALCGFSDWRVPHINELQSLLSINTTSYIDTGYFPGMPPVLWSTTAFASGPDDGGAGDENQAWGIQFVTGGLSAARNRDASIAVQLVRSEP